MDQPPAQQLQKSGEKLADSATKLAKSSERIEDTADRRTVLAANRTVFAAERTYAAWVRTGLFALASGVGSRELLKGLMPEDLIKLNAGVLLLFSAFCFFAGIWRHLHPGAAPPQPEVHQIPPYLLIAVNGF